MSRIENAMEKAIQRRGDEAFLEPQKQLAPLKDAQPAPPGPPAPPEPQVSAQYGKLKPDGPFLVNLHDQHSGTAEEYRKLKSVLVKMTKENELFRNAIMITSAIASEGKSLTAVNLSLSLAQELDHTVLLIDADLRRPSLHRYLNIEQGPGLSDILSGKAEIGETIIPTGIGKLSIIRAGGMVDNPAELFSSLKMEGVVKELKHRYPDRYLIFDAPPVLPFAETRSLAHLVDGVLFVVRERLASQVQVSDALDALKGCERLGLVYNAAALSGDDGRYSYYRGSEGKQL